MLHLKKKIKLPNIPMLQKPVIAINIDFKKKKEHLVIGDFDNVNRFLRGQKDVEIILRAEEIFGNILTRDNEFCHLTASAFIVNKSHNKVLCIYHNIYKSWGWVGGHADGDDDMMYVSMKEAREETSLEKFNVIQEMPI